MGISGADSNRKRSRSPSDSDQQKTSKRPNTGPALSSDEAAAHSTDSVSKTPAIADVTMTTSVTAAVSDDRSLPTKSKEEGSTDTKNGATTSADPSSSTSGAPPPSAHIHMRCLIVTQDASIIIGKAGAHVNEIREKSGARVMVSESIPGNPERILNVSGPLDAVSKVSVLVEYFIQNQILTTLQAFGLIVRRINDEPFDVPSVPGSRAVTIKFMIPNSRMGSVIGKSGCKIKEIQDASGARLNASEGMLPGSTEVGFSFSLCDHPF